MEEELSVPERRKTRKAGRVMCLSITSCRVGRMAATDYRAVLEVGPYGLGITMRRAEINIVRSKSK